LRRVALNGRISLVLARRTQSRNAIMPAARHVRTNP
jgi:hypothetical protein